MEGVLSPQMKGMTPVHKPTTLWNHEDQPKVIVEFTQTILVTLSMISHLWTQCIHIILFRLTSVIVALQKGTGNITHLSRDSYIQ